jgi:hypothetical protein
MTMMMMMMMMMIKTTFSVTTPPWEWLRLDVRLVCIISFSLLLYERGLG